MVNAHSVTPIKSKLTQADIERIMAENQALKAKLEKKQTISCKVGQKGGVSVYGLGRFPVTLYAEQWPRLFGAQSMIEEFIEEHKDELKFKE